MLTPEQLQIAKEIHDHLFSIFVYETDQEQFHVIDVWPDPQQLEAELAAGKLVGDCDDFALACRHLLWKKNVPNRIIYCLDEEGEGHCVCEAEGYILDNRRPHVVPASDLPYKWVKMSGYQVGDPWTEISA